MKSKQIVVTGNNIEVLKKYPDNYFDSIVTDPPYGLGKEPNAFKMLKAWLDCGYFEVKGKGFMGKEWDAFVPQPIFWKEIFRVLKHGGHVVSFFGTRTYDIGVLAMRLAGFEIRDCMQWLYGSGFPKSHNIGVAVDKIQGNERSSEVVKGKVFTGSNNNIKGQIGEYTITKGNSEWEGWGTALKPANEPIVLARKPLEKGLSIAENVLKWGTGGINIDISRIPTSQKDKDIIDAKASKNPTSNYSEKDDKIYGKYKQDVATPSNDLGRFPTNVLLSHHDECKCKIEKHIYEYTNEEEIVEIWDCHEDCPIKILDEQSGITTSGKSKNKKESYDGESVTNFLRGRSDDSNQHGDTGGASRFFYVAKAGNWERNYGLDGFEEKQTSGGGGGIGNYANDVNSASGKFGSEKAPRKNFHPTVKPIKLMQYLVRLVTPPNGKVLDPFAGSGTTGCACKIDGFEFLGIELFQEHTDIANSRIKAFEEEQVLIDETKIFKSRNDSDDSDDSRYEQLNLF